jgi:MFS family permease
LGRDVGQAAGGMPPQAERVLDATPDEGARRGALAVWSASGAAAGALGFLVGGILTQSLSWRAVFWINVPVGLLLLLAIVVVVPPSKLEHDPAPLDLVGAVFLVTSVMALIVGASLIEDPHRRSLGGVLVAAGVGLGFVLVAHQRRSSAPLLPRAAFASANLRTGTALSFVNTATTTSAGVLATLLLEQQFNVSAIGAGFALLPFSLGVIAGSALSKPLGSHLSGRRLAVGGLAAIAAGNVKLAITYGSIVGIVVGVVVAGTGLGAASVAANAIGTEVADGLRGTATGVLNTGAQLGSAIGVAALVVLAATVIPAAPSRRGRFAAQALKRPGDRA